MIEQTMATNIYISAMLVSDMVRAQVWLKLYKSESTEIPTRSEDKQPLLKQNSEYISPIFSIENQNQQKCRLLCHDYTKFKTTPFNCRQAFLPNEPLSKIANRISENLTNSVFQHNENFCHITMGSVHSGVQQTFEGDKNKEGLLYSSLIRVRDKVTQISVSKETENFGEKISIGQKSDIKMVLKLVTVVEGRIIDLLNSGNNVQLVENHSEIKVEPKLQSHQHKLFTPLRPLNFEGACEFYIQDRYQLYTVLKKAFYTRQQIGQCGIMIAQLRFKAQGESSSKELKQALLIEWVKDSPYSSVQSKKTCKEKPLLCLNQSILEIYKFLESSKSPLHEDRELEKIGKKVFSPKTFQKLKSIQCFRNSTITRILKPYLLFNSQIVIMGCCSVEEVHQSDSHQTLMLCKHISKISSFKFEENVNPSSQQKEGDCENNLSPGKADLAKQAVLGSQNKDPEGPFSPDKIRSLTEEVKNVAQMVNNQIGQSRKKSHLRIYPKKQHITIEHGHEEALRQYAESMKAKKLQGLKVRKQISIFKTKEKIRNIRQLTQQHSSDDFKKQQQMHEFQLQKKVQEQRQIQKQIEQISLELKKKISSFKSRQQGSFTAPQSQVKLLGVLKKQLLNELSLTQMEANETLEEKKAMKQIYSEELDHIRKREHSLIRHFEEFKHREKQNNSIHVSSGARMIKSYHLNPLPRMRFGQNEVRKETQKGKQPKILTINRNKSVVSEQKANKRYATEQTDSVRINLNKRDKNLKTGNGLNSNVSKRFSHKDIVQKGEKDSEQTLKISRNLARKRKQLKTKVAKGRVQYSFFLDEIAKNYENYSPPKKKSAKRID